MMNKMHVNSDGEIRLDDDMLAYLDLRKGEEVIFFEEDGCILIVNAARPTFKIMLCKPERPSVRMGMRI
jgi:hypothetical protein